MPEGHPDAVDGAVRRPPVPRQPHRVAPQAASTAPASPAAAVSRRDRRVLIAALLLTGLSMRTAVTTVGATLADIERGLHTNSGVAGVITTLPALCFAVLGALAPRLASRSGPHRLLVLALTAMTIGVVTRAFVSSVFAFLVLSVLSLAGAAIANVLMPTEVKTHFPDRIGAMTALYTTAMAVGTTAGAGLTVPIGSLAPGPDSWRVGIGSWALLSALAVVPWLAIAPREDRSGSAARRTPFGALVRSRTAWMVTLFFAFQSTQAYIAFGWFERFLTEHHISDSTAGWMVALMSAMAIPASMIAPTVPQRHHRLLVVILGAAFAGAYAGMNAAPALSWLWMVLAGIGGGMFPLSLTLMGYRTATPTTTASLSAFAQGIGYSIAACGPVLFGALRGATGGWAASFTVLWVAVIAATIAGWLASAPRTVDEDMQRMGTRHREDVSARAT